MDNLLYISNMMEAHDLAIVNNQQGDVLELKETMEGLLSRYDSPELAGLVRELRSQSNHIIVEVFSTQLNNRSRLNEMMDNYQYVLDNEQYEPAKRLNEELHEFIFKNYRNDPKMKKKMIQLSEDSQRIGRIGWKDQDKSGRVK